MEHVLFQAFSYLIREKKFKNSRREVLKRIGALSHDSSLVFINLAYNSLAKTCGTCQTGGCFFGTRNTELFLNLLRD